MEDPSRARVTGPLQAYAAGFVAELARLGYTTQSACGQMLLMAHVSRWLAGGGLEMLARVRERLGALAEWNAASIHGALNELAAALGAGLGKVAQPLRVAVTGTAVSPPIDATLELLGRERALARIDEALRRASP